MPQHNEPFFNGRKQSESWKKKVARELNTAIAVAVKLENIDATFDSQEQLQAQAIRSIVNRVAEFEGIETV